MNNIQFEVRDNFDNFDEYFSCSESDDEDNGEDLHFDGYDSDTGTLNSASEDELNISFAEEDDNYFSFSFGDTIAKALVLWAVKFGISHTALTELLKILKRFGHNELPNLARTLLHTPRKAVQPRACGSGEFYYRGIKFNLLYYNQAFLTETDTIEFDFFIDGLSLSDSSKVKMWPIMGSFSNQPYIRPFVVGCYSGDSDPIDVDDYMREFVDEIKYLQHNGIEVTKDRVTKKFRFRCFIADAPACAFASSTMGHASFFGCPKCDQVCCVEGHKLYYQFFVGGLRTDESFRTRVDIQHHKPQFQYRASLIEGVIGMVSQFVIDPMHAVDLGVTKRICKAIFNNDVLCSKLSKAAFVALQARFKSFRAYVPSDFARLPRTLNQLNGFKATEFRQLLLYTLPVLIKNIVSPQLYKNVIKLHVAIRLLSDPVRYKANINAARKLIDDFVYEYDDIFGKKHFTFYTHCLLHIPDYADRYGPLYSFSAYKFENHMRLIKRLLRRKHGHIKQFFNRVDEMRFADDLKEVDDRECKFNDFTLEANSLRDGCCMVEPGHPFVITEFINQNGVQVIRGNRFTKCIDFYDDPIPSMENMGIILASDLSFTVEEFPTIMERLILSKWTKPKCAEYPALTTTFVNRSVPLKNARINPKPAPHFRSKKKNPIMLESEALENMKTSNTNDQNNKREKWSTTNHSGIEQLNNHKFAVPLKPPPKRKFQETYGPANTPVIHPIKIQKSQSNAGAQFNNYKSNGESRELQKNHQSLTPPIHQSRSGYTDGNVITDKNQLVPLPSSWKGRNVYSNDFRVNNNVLKTQTQEGVKLISSVAISADETNQKNYSKLPLKLSSAKNKPWTSFTRSSSHGCKTTDSISIETPADGCNKGATVYTASKQDHASIVGKKILLSTAMVGKLVPFPSTVDKSGKSAFPLKEIIEPEKENPGRGLLSLTNVTSCMKTHQASMIQPVQTNIVKNNGPQILSRINAAGTPTKLMHPATSNTTIVKDSGPQILSRVNSADTSATRNQSSLVLHDGENSKNNQFVSLEEFNKLKNKQAKCTSVIKAIVRKLKKEDSEVASFSFPLDNEPEYLRFKACLEKVQFTDKLTASLEKKIIKCNDVVSELVETIFHPKLLFGFNLNGYQGKSKFKDTKINQIFFALSKMDYDKYYYELTKVIHKMHTRHRRSLLV